MIFLEDKGTGYMYCYAPDHYCANKAGKVLEHVMVMADYIGRKLLSIECVHEVKAIPVYETTYRNASGDYAGPAKQKHSFLRVFLFRR